MSIQDSPDPAPRRYAAFISYRHADNREEGRRWAEWLHQALETYEVPTDLVGTRNERGGLVPASLFPIFRDEEELPADADLTTNIQRALERSAALIVLCSPRACESRFVHEEIVYYKQLGGSTRILSVLLEGEPNATDDPGKRAAGFAPEQECLPLALRFGRPQEGAAGVDWEARAEPIAADVRPQGLPAQGWTTPAAYNAALRKEGRPAAEVAELTEAYAQRLQLAILKIVAGLLDLPLGLLTQRDKARQLEQARGRARRLRLIAAGFGALAMAAVALGLVAWVQKERAVRAQAEEQRQRREADQARANERAADERRQRLLAEAARSDRLTALEKFGTARESDGFAHLARAITYDETSLLAPEAALAALNQWNRAGAQTVVEEKEARDAAGTPDGQFLVTANGNVWSTASSQLAVKAPGEEKLVSLSADGRRLLAIAEDGSKVRIRDVATGKIIVEIRIKEATGGSPGTRGPQVNVPPPLGAFPGPPGLQMPASPRPSVSPASPPAARFSSASFSPDGKRLVTASNDGLPRVWETETGRLTLVLDGNLFDQAERTTELYGGGPRFDHRGLGRTARFSANGQRIVTDGAVWEAETGKLLCRLQIPPRDTAAERGPLAGYNQPEELRDFQISPDGRRVTAGIGGAVLLWDAANGWLMATGRGHQHLINSARFSPDGRTVLTASNDHTVREWNAEDGKERRVLAGHQDTVNLAEYSADGTQIVSASNDRTIRIWSGENDQPRVLQGHEGPVLAAHFFPASNGTIISAARDGTVRVWKAGEQYAGHLGPLEHGRARPTAFSPDGRRFIVPGNGPRNTQIFDVETGKVVATITSQIAATLGNIEFSPGAERFVELSEVGPARVWETATGKVLASVQPRGKAASFSAGGKRIATIDYQEPQVWDVNAAKMVRAFPHMPGTVRRLVLSADGKRLVTLAEPSKLWEVESGRQVAVLALPGSNNSFMRAAAFSPDSQLLAATGVARNGDTTSRVLIWRVTDGQLLTTCGGSLGTVNSLEFSPDGQHLLAAGDDRTARMWDVATGRELVVFHGHQGAVMSARFRPDGRRMVTISRDKTVRVWDATNGELVALLPGSQFSVAPDGLETPRFGPEGRYILYATEKKVIVFPFLPSSAGVAPAWFPGFLRFLGQRRFNETGELEDLPRAEWLQLRDELRQTRKATLNDNDAFSQTLRRFTDPS